MKRYVLILLLLTAGHLMAQDVPPAAPPDPAIALNNEGVALIEKGDFKGAIAKLRDALDVHRDDRHPSRVIVKKNLVAALLGQASQYMSRREFNRAERSIVEARRVGGATPPLIAYEGILAYRRGNLTQAMSLLQDALRADAGLAVAHEFLGMVQYKKEDLPRAIKSWEAAIRFDRSRGKHLLPLIAKARREHAIESRMQVLRSSHFVCKFGDEQSRSVANEILRILEDAYSTIGEELRVYPRELLTAVLYANQDFRGATSAQAWAAGIFDGKIRVPVRNFDKARESIRRTLFHEYTHFAVSRMCRRVPAWLNEGLAQRFEGLEAGGVQAFLSRTKEAGQLKKMQLLSASFATMKDTASVRLAYSQSLSFVAFLEDTYTRSRLIEVLRRMGKGLKADQALRRILGRNLAELEALWLDSL